MSATLVTAAAGIAKRWMGLESQESSQDHELELAIVQATGSAARLGCMAFLLGPWAAPLLPWVTAADVADYLTTVSGAIPDWQESALQGAILGMWGMSERSVHKAKAARAERARRDHSSATGGGG